MSILGKSDGMGGAGLCGSRGCVEVEAPAVEVAEVANKTLSAVSDMFKVS